MTPARKERTGGATCRCEEVVTTRTQVITDLLDYRPLIQNYRKPLNRPTFSQNSGSIAPLCRFITPEPSDPAVKRRRIKV